MNACETIGDDGPEFIDAPGRRLSERGLELREGYLDRVEVRGVWRQERKPRADLLDCLAHAADLVSGQIVHDNDITGAKCGCENLLGIGKEGWTVHRAVE